MLCMNCRRGEAKHDTNYGIICEECWKSDPYCMDPAPGALPPRFYIFEFFDKWHAQLTNGKLIVTMVPDRETAAHLAESAYVDHWIASRT